MDKKHLVLSFLLLAPTLAATGCWRSDIRTVEFSVPKLSSSDCSKYVLSVLRETDGVRQAQPDLQTQTLTVTYNARVTALKNIEYAIANMGFDIDDTPGKAEAKAKLPESCR